MQVVHKLLRAIIKFAHPVVSKDNACPRCIFNGKFTFTIFARDTADGSRKMVTFENLNVSDHEAIYVQIIDAQERDCIYNLKTKHIGTDKICCFLQTFNILSVIRSLRDRKLFNQMQREERSSLVAAREPLKKVHSIALDR